MAFLIPYTVDWLIVAAAAALSWAVARPRFAYIVH